MNYIKQVAEMFGVELNEEFRLRGMSPCTYRFTEENVLEFRSNGGDWNGCGSLRLECMLMGKDEIIKLPFEPQMDDEYYTYSGSSWKIIMDSWEDYTVDFLRKSAGVVFRTYEEAAKARPEIYEKMTGKKWEE